MIQVWSDKEPAGLLDRHGNRGSTFAYQPTPQAKRAEAKHAEARRAVSMTMPVRLASWDHSWGIHPIFEMNLPEGALREKLRLSFAKAVGTFDDFDLLSIVGQSQVGRLRYTPADASLDEHVPFQSVEEILRHRRDGELFAYMLNRFASFSGISGIQPKVLIRDEADSAILAKSIERKSSSFRGATHIVKFWDAREYPHLAANEFFCLLAARKCGLDVPLCRLADDGSALVIDRFDLRADGTYLGMEDFCVLNALGTAEKYKGGYETALFKRAREFIPGEILIGELEKLFLLFSLNCALRNGDAHLKNFALIYGDVTGGARLAPAFDIVTTTVYIPQDAMALTLDGTTRWPNAKRLASLGATRCGLTPRRIKELFERIAEAITETSTELRSYVNDQPTFSAVGERMLHQWAEGVENALGFEPPAWRPRFDASEDPAPTLTMD